MNEFVAGVLRLIVRLVVVAMGLVLFVSLLAAVMVLALVWTLRAGWARLAGQPVTPWVMRMDPRTGFSTAFRSTQRWSTATRAAAQGAGDGTQGTEGPEEPVASRRGGILPGAAQVSDVEARELR